MLIDYAKIFGIHCSRRFIINRWKLVILYKVTNLPAIIIQIPIVNKPKSLDSFNYKDDMYNDIVKLQTITQTT